MLYHYTSGEALKCILETGRIRLTHSGFLNDPNEITYLHGWLRRMMVELGERYSRETEDEGERALNFFLNTFVRYFAHPELGVLTELDDHFSRMPFVFSLSGNGDQLGQWRAYCRGGGYSIGFHEKLLVACIKPQKAALAQCIYGQGESKSREFVSRWVDNLATAYMNEVERDPDYDPRNLAKRFREDARAEAEALSVVHKAPAFAEELEWRVAARPRMLGDETVNWSSGTWCMRPYIELQLPEGKDFPIQEVVAPMQSSPNSPLSGCLCATEGT